MSWGNDVKDLYTPEQIERLKQGFPWENSVRLTKKEAAALLLLREMLDDRIVYENEVAKSALAKLKAYIEQP